MLSTDFSLCLCSRWISLFAYALDVFLSLLVFLQDLKFVCCICLLALLAAYLSCIPLLVLLSASLTMGVPDITAMTSQLDALLRPDLTLSDVSRQKLFEVGQLHPIDLSNGSVQACLPLVTEVAWLSIWGVGVADPFSVG